MRPLLRLLLKVLFGYEFFGAAALKTPGPVLLIPNHVSWLDWLFLLALLDDDWRFVVSSTTAQFSWVHRKLMLNHRTFPIDPASPYAMKRMAEHLQSGGRLVLFAEGRITYTGNLMKLYDGTGFLLFKTPAKVITCYLRGLERLRWSRQPGRRVWWPKVTAHFSPALQRPDAGDVRTSQARTFYTAWLRDRMISQQFETEMTFGPGTVHGAIAHTARQQPGFEILEDFNQQPLTCERLLTGARALSQALDRSLNPRSQNPRVGILLPNINATPVTLIALWATGRTPAILNFSTGPAVMLQCAKLAGLRQILTSRAFIEKAKLNLLALEEAGIRFVYLEDVKASLGASDRLLALIAAKFAADPLNANSMTPGETAVVLFTSGSEGVPKGVELTHQNLLANIRQMLAVTDLTDHDRIFNALPLFHSFGLTVGTLLGLVRGLYVFLYPSPLHYRLIPNILYDRNCTVFLATNTFLNGYARRAHAYDFRSMRYLFAAAEKIQEATFLTWAKQFGVRILEGYGATECSPALSINVPMAPSQGTAGRFLPGIEWKITPIDGVPAGGRLLVRGPNVMKGYLNPEANAAFQALQGWYDTGDIVEVDASGFVHILGRLKRFAKVSGEMVSLAAVEDALAGAFPQHGSRCMVPVITRPDPDKGEVLIAVSNEPRLTLEEIRAAIKARGLTNLCVPREIRHLRQIPLLGTGKVNYRELQRLLEAGQLPEA